MDEGQLLEAPEEAHLRVTEVVTHESHKAFEVEQRGIGYIPSAQRDGTPLRVGLLWTTAVTNIGFITFGGLLPLIGLSFLQSVVVILVGSLTWFLVGAVALAGPACGTTTLMISRSVFGANGNRIVGVLTWIMYLGFEAYLMIIIVQAGLGVSSHAGFGTGNLVKVVTVIVTGLLVPVIAIYGHGTLAKVYSWLAIPTILVFLLVLAVIVPHLHVPSTSHSGSWQTMMIGFGLMFSAIVGYAPQGADYSRYLREDVSRWKLLLSNSLSGYVPSAGVMLLGAAVGSAAGLNEITGVLHLTPGWFVYPFLILVAVQVMFCDAFCLYSSGVTLQAIGVKLKRWRCAWIDNVLCVGATFVALYVVAFHTLVTDFLDLLNIYVAPFAAVFIAQWLFNRGKYHVAALQTAEPGSAYWYRGGFNPIGMCSLLVGMLAAGLFMSSTVFVGPFASALGGPDLSWAAGFVLSAVTYAAWTMVVRRSQPRGRALEESSTARCGGGQRVTHVPSRAGAPLGADRKRNLDCE